MAVSKVMVPVEGRVLKRVDRLVARGEFSSRVDALATVVAETFRPGRRALSVADVLEIVRRGREEHRSGRARVIRSSAELR